MPTTDLPRADPRTDGDVREPLGPRPESARISPTAHYTGHVWFRNGLSHAALQTREGARLFAVTRPVFELVSRMTSGLSLERMLLQRHRIIDHVLADAIEFAGITQVLEIAGGMSGRGMRFSRRFADRGLVYVEGDLPDMARRKRAALADADLRSRAHHVVALDVLASDGPRALAEATRGLLDPSRPTAIVTEGLVNYFDRDRVVDMWRRFVELLAPSGGVYLSDLHTREEIQQYVTSRVFMRALGIFARGKIHIHFEHPEEARHALLGSGFTRARLPTPDTWRGTLDIPLARGPELLRVIEAWVEVA